MNDRILFVDDEKNVLEGYKRLLRGDFNVETALGGAQALAELHIFGPCAIVISDMRMPGMNGAEFLAQVRQIAPNTVRMLLTGYKDANEAAQAVNQGRIFRYLNKPCRKSDLVLAINLGLEQYRVNVDDRQAINQARNIRLHAATLNNMLLARKPG